MPEVSFTKENLLERNQLSAGWRRLKVKEVNEGPGKSDPTSTVYPITFIVEEGPDSGTPINHWFTEKQMGRMSDFIKCFVDKVEIGKKYELSSTVGRSVMGYCQYDTGTGFNVIKDFQAVKK